jgi:hypothetical protein
MSFAGSQPSFAESFGLGSWPVWGCRMTNPGRPPLSPEGTVMLSLRVPQSIMDRLAELKPKGLSTSAYVMLLLEAEAERKTKRPRRAFFD